MDTVADFTCNRLADVRTQALPYGVQMLPNGMFQVFNRDYKALGEPFVFERQRKEFTPRSTMDAIFFYNDATNPSRSERNLNAYLKKMGRFMRAGVRLYA